MSHQPRNHYQAPGFVTRRIMNPAVAALTRMGISVWGSRVLEVRGRRSGALRHTPVNVLELEGRRYLVSPRGECEWVRNVRADEGRLALLLGRQRHEAVAQELPDEHKAPVLAAYLKRWQSEVGVFFDGVRADASAEDLSHIAPDHPVFELFNRAA